MTLQSRDENGLGITGAGSTAMDESAVWETIATAPYDRDLELAVVEEEHIHALVFACRRAAYGWIRASTSERILVNPTHWRLWQNS
jgi:hypothetical protein